MPAMILPTTTELRQLTAAKAAPQIMRATDSDDDAKRFVGHASVFDTRTLIGVLPWGFYEEFAPGSFTDTIADAGESIGVDQALLLDHDSHYVVSRRSAGTLRLAQDSVGLAVDSDLDEELDYVSGRLIPNLRNGNITGMSIGFYVREATWDTVSIESEAGPIEVDLRRITQVDLLEASAVTFPAFRETDAALRDVAAALRSRDDDAAIRRHVDAAGRFAPALRAILDAPPAELAKPARSLSRRAELDRRVKALAAYYRL